MPVVEIDGRELSVTNLDKVLYPDGFTKAEVIDYYVRVAPAMLPHVQGRGVTLRRYPNGVDGTSFFEKRSPDHRPEWIGTALGPGDRKGGIQYLVIDEVATLAWVGNMAALEVHAPMARAVDIDAPTMVVFDLDPGAPATIVDCCRVALEIQDVLADLDLQIWPKTSGSKGMQLYLPLNTPHTHEHASSFALARMVMPRSRSRSFESITRSATRWFSRTAPDCLSSASTSVVLPWSTCAMIAMLRSAICPESGADSCRLPAGI